MSEKLLAKTATLPVQATLIALIMLIISMDSLYVQARPSPLTKKPPFNGSMFGKRAVLPAIPSPAYDRGSSNVASTTNPTPRIENENAYNVWNAMLYKQLQEQQDLAMLSAAISRCLAQQREGLPVGADIIDVCEDLYALASVRDRLS